MDGSFWTGAAAAFVIGIAGSVIANIFDNPLQRYLQQRRSIVDSTKRGKELWKYAKLRAMHDGSRDKAAEFVISSLSIIVLTIYGIGMLSTALILAIVWVPTIDLNKQNFVTSLEVWLVMGMFIGGFIAMVSSLRRRNDINTENLRLTYFDHYQAEIYQKFGGKEEVEKQMIYYGAAQETFPKDDEKSSPKGVS